MPEHCMLHDSLSRAAVYGLLILIFLSSAGCLAETTLPMPTPSPLEAAAFIPEPSPTPPSTATSTSTSTPAASPTLTQTVPPPTATLPAPTPTQTASPTPTLPSLPSAGQALSAENAVRLEELSQWGKGHLLSQQILPGGQAALLETTSNLRIVSTSTLQEIVVFEGGDQVLLSPDQRFLAVTFKGESRLEIWEMPQAVQTAVLEHTIEAPRYPPEFFSLRQTRSISALTFSPDSSLLAASFGSGEILLWRTSDWQQTALLSSSISMKAQKLRISRDGRYLASYEEVPPYSKIRLVFWDLDKFAVLGYIPEPGNLVNDPFSNDSTYFLTASGSKVLIWNLRELSLVRSFTTGFEYVFEAWFAPDEEFLLITGLPEAVQVRRFWDGKRLNLEKEKEALAGWGYSEAAQDEPARLDPDRLEQDGYYPPFQRVHAAAGGQSVLAWGSDGARLYWLRLPEQVFTQVELGSSPMAPAALSPGEDTLAVCLTDKNLALIDLDSRAVTLIAGCRPGGVLAFLTGERLLRANGVLVDVVDLPQGGTTSNLRGHTAPVQVLFAHPSGNWIVSGTSKLTNHAEAVVWTTEPSLSRAFQFDIQVDDLRGVVGAAISPDGSQVVAARSMGGVDAYHLPGRYQQWYARVFSVSVMTYSPDGSLLAMSNRSEHIYVIETVNGRQVFPDLELELNRNWDDWLFRIPRGSITGISFLPDGSGLFTVGSDGIVRFLGVR
jgi:WD40 repeat protein